MFDAFVNTMMKPHIARNCARKINAQTKAKAQQLENFAKDILAESKVDASVSCRVKSVDSTASKLMKNIRNFDSYENKREEILDIFLGKGMGEIVGDSFGIRFTANTPDTSNFFHTIFTKAKSGKDFYVTGIENYHGAGIRPYADNGIMDNFAKLNYRTSRGIVKETTATNALKPSGYTRDNINGIINGVNTEIQIGGKHTTKWGDAEHWLYDIRQGKKADLSKLTKEQKKIALQLEREYSALLSRPKAHKYFVDNYLNKIWAYMRNSEIKGLEIPEFPSFPKGYPSVLKAENIIKLAHV